MIGGPFNARECAERCYEEMRQLRRTLHERPELGHCEYEATNLIKKCLDSWNIETLDLGLKTGAAAVIKGSGDGRFLALREDIDALPIEENTGLPFSSKTAGVCHACGHDIHTAALLGCAKILAEHKGDFRGEVMLIFQPAEECFDGAAEMLKKGLFRNSAPDAVVGFHCAPEIPLGTIGVRRGISNASCDTITIRIIGKEGHGAHPEHCVDPITVSAYLLTQLQTIISRDISPLSPAVLSFGQIMGGSAPNIIPRYVELHGTLRAFNNAVRGKALRAIRRISSECSAAMKAKSEVSCENSMPPLINSREICAMIEEAGAITIGKDNVITSLEPSLGSDDFSCLLAACKDTGAQFLVGTGDDAVPASKLGLHVAENIFPDKTLFVAAGVMAQFAMEYLHS